MIKRVAAIGLAWLALASSAAAHPGHGRGGGDYGLPHYLTEPAHLLSTVLVLVVVAMLGTYATRTLRSGRRR
jgi:hydrogenase/urease accessory protein HupE